MNCRVCARRQSSMADNGLGVCMPVMGIDKDRPFISEIAETVPAQSAIIAIWQVASQRINGDLKYQPWLTGVGPTGGLYTFCKC